MATAQKALPQPEELLLDYAERLAHHRAGRKALCLALSQLAPTSHPDGHWRLVENLLAPVVRRRGGEIFRLRNGDVVAVLTSADLALTDRLTLKLRYFFRDDPAVIRDEESGAKSFCRWFDLNEAYEPFLALARARCNSPLDEADPELDQAALPAAASADQRERNAPLLTPLIRWFALPPIGPRAIERLAESSPCARLRPGEPPQLAFELLEPKADAVLDIGFPARDLERNPELVSAFRSLAARRLLIELPGARKPAEPVALTLTLDVLLGTEFLSLHRAWAVARWTPLTLIVTHDDATADGRRFRYVRDMLRALGHRLGVGEAPLELLAERRRLNADLVAFRWQRAYGEGGVPGLDAVIRAFAERSPEDILLTGADTREALAFARKLGISLVAGRQAALQLGKG